MANMDETETSTTPERDNGCVLICIGLFIGVTLGAFLGAFILSALQYFYYVYFKPDILKDAQWGMVFLATIPIGGIGGGILGALAGVLIARRA
jgi:hypothetical protein